MITNLDVILDVSALFQYNQHLPLCFLGHSQVYIYRQYHDNPMELIIALIYFRVWSSLHAVCHDFNSATLPDPVGAIHGRNLPVDEQSAEPCAVLGFLYLSHLITYNRQL